MSKLNREEISYSEAVPIKIKPSQEMELQGAKRSRIVQISLFIYFNAYFCVYTHTQAHPGGQRKTCGNEFCPPTIGFKGS